MNENTAVRDELARLAGWENHPEYGWCHADEQYIDGRPHPIPNTLDAAATLPEGWEAFKNQTHGWWARFRVGELHIPVRKTNTGDEKADRFALRLAVEKIEHERKAK